MLTLYVKTGCPYCAVALKKVDDLGLTIDEKNIADPFVSDELIEKGGKRQVPFLIDSDKDVLMYESSAIANYLEENYGGEVATPVAAVPPSTIRLHRSDDSEVCEACQ